MNAIRLLLAVPLLLVGPLTLRAGEAKGADKAYIANARQAAAQLSLDLERLEEAVLADATGKEAEQLQRQAEQVWARLAKFQEVIKPGLTADDLLAKYEPLDRATRALIGEVRAAGREERGLQRAADYVSSSNEELFYAIACQCGLDKQAGELVQRQAAVLHAAAEDLAQAGRVGGGDRLNQAVLVGQLKNLKQVTEQFQSALKNTASQEERQKQFAAVNRAWLEASTVLRLLPPGDNVYLLRAASRFDRIHARLHELLGMKGERPQLIIRS